MGSAVPGVVHDDQRDPLPRPKPVPRAHTTPLLPADLGQERWLKHGGGEQRRGGNLETDRQTLVWGWDGKPSVPYWHSWRWRRSCAGEGRVQGQDGAGM